MKRPPKDLIYVTVQLILFVVYFWVPPVLRWHLVNWLQISTIILAFLGVLICAISLWQLKRNLTPFPSPVTGGQLITSGMFRWARHPIYSGLILFFSAYGVYSESFGRLLVAMLIIILFYFKSRYEEHLLEKTYPQYSLYKHRTGRFFPRPASSFDL